MNKKLGPGVWQIGNLIYEIERDSAIHGYEITVTSSGNVSAIFIPDVLLVELSPATMFLPKLGSDES